MRIGICDDDKQDLQLIYEVCKNSFEALNTECEIHVFQNQKMPVNPRITYCN